MFVLSHSVHHVDPESQVTEQVYYVDHYGFGYDKLVQIAEVRLYCASDPSGMFRRGTMTIIIFRQVSLLTRGTFHVSFDNHIKYFLSCDIFNIHNGSRATNADIYGWLWLEAKNEIHQG